MDETEEDTGRETPPFSKLRGDARSEAIQTERETRLLRTDVGLKIVALALVASQHGQ